MPTSWKRDMHPYDDVPNRFEQVMGAVGTVLSYRRVEIVNARVWVIIGTLSPPKNTLGDILDVR